MLNGVHELQKHGVVHRDIKTENILLDSMYNIKIADFGQANTIEEGRTENQGTLLYMAPEILLNKSTSYKKGDVWSLGIVLD